MRTQPHYAFRGFRFRLNNCVQMHVLFYFILHIRNCSNGNENCSMVTLTAAGSLILKGVNPTGKEIGRGAYGRVFEVNYEGTLCAAKEVHALLLQYAQGDDLEKIKDDFLSECQIWSTLRHPCVVQFLGSVILVL